MSPTNKILGYPPDARLLLVNADDFGMYASINDGVVRACQEGVVRSTSLMLPCPGAVDAIRRVGEIPGISVGIHLSVICDIDQYRWGPVAPKDTVRSLLDETGQLYAIARMAELLDRAEISELEIEFRAQIDAALSAGVEPTHLDWHCLFDGGRDDIFDLTLGLAREYGLAVRVWKRRNVERVQQLGLPTNEFDPLDSFGLSLDEKADRYAHLLHELPAGLTEWAVHPSLGDSESRIIDPDGWQVRRTDFDFLVSARAREIIDEEGIILVTYAPIQEIWERRPRSQ